MAPQGVARQGYGVIEGRLCLQCDGGTNTPNAGDQQCPHRGPAGDLLLGGQSNGSAAGATRGVVSLSYAGTAAASAVASRATASGPPQRITTTVRSSVGGWVPTWAATAASRRSR